MRFEECCDICDCNEYSTVFKDRVGYGYDIIKCNKCGLVSIYPKRTLKEIVSYYNCKKDKAVAIPKKDLHRAHKKIDKFKSKIGKSVLYQKGYYKDVPRKFYMIVLGLLFEKFMFKGFPNFHGKGRVLDVGCNNGLYLYLLKNIGWKVFGVEIDSKACEAARSLGINCFAGTLKEAKYPDKFFDVIRLYHVLEHVSSPGELFSEIRRLLKQNGILYAAFPNQRSFGFYVFKHIWQGYRGHLYAFSPSTFTKLCDKFGFKVEKIQIKSSVGAFINNIVTWSQGQNRLIESATLVFCKTPIFKVLLLKPFSCALNLLGLGDICEAKIRVDRGQV